MSNMAEIIGRNNGYLVAFVDMDGRTPHTVYFMTWKGAWEFIKPLLRQGRAVEVTDFASDRRFHMHPEHYALRIRVEDEQLKRA